MNTVSDGSGERDDGSSGHLPGPLSMGEGEHHKPRLSLGFGSIVGRPWATCARLENLKI